jgi:hypothetical protein
MRRRAGRCATPSGMSRCRQPERMKWPDRHWRGDLRYAAANFSERAPAFWGDLRQRRRYRHLSEQELVASRTSETVFILGSGASINDIDPAEWAGIGRHNTFSLSQGFRLEHVRVDYHLLAEVHDLEECGRFLDQNACFRDAILITQQGWLASAPNEMIRRRLLPSRSRLFRYHRIARGRYAPPSRSFSEGIVHAYNSIVDCVNISYLMGFTRIVLVGVDMYDKQYFFLPKDFTRDWELPGITANSPFPYGQDTKALFQKWHALFASEGIDLRVFNPRSIMAEVMDVFDRRELAG